MSETFEAVVETTIDRLLDYIFTCTGNEGGAIRFVYEFSGRTVAEKTIEACEPMGMAFEHLIDEKRPFVVQVVVEDVMRTKFFIVLKCARKADKYRRMNKEIDFECHGRDWRAPELTPADKLTLCQNIYNKTYGCRGL